MRRELLGFGLASDGQLAIRTVADTNCVRMPEHISEWSLLCLPKLSLIIQLARQRAKPESACNRLLAERSTPWFWPKMGRCGEQLCIKGVDLKYRIFGSVPIDHVASCLHFDLFFIRSVGHNESGQLGRGRRGCGSFTIYPVEFSASSKVVQVC